MVASVFLFSFQNAIGKWLAQSYPIPMLVFFRSAVALAPSYMLVMRAGGVRVLRTNRLGAQFGRAAIWGGSNVASFFAYHLLPLADAVALTFAAPLFLTALSWPILKERVGRERWIAVSVGFVGVLVMARPSGAGNWAGMAFALTCAICNAVDTVFRVQPKKPRSGGACQRARYSQGQGAPSRAGLRPSLTSAARADRRGDRSGRRNDRPQSNNGIGNLPRLRLAWRQPDQTACLSSARRSRGPGVCAWPPPRSAWA